MIVRETDVEQYATANGPLYGVVQWSGDSSYPFLVCVAIVAQVVPSTAELTTLVVG